jgi:hypothetical protein
VSRKAILRLSVQVVQLSPTGFQFPSSSQSSARQVFDEIWVKDKQVIAVKPRPELKPFFQLSYEEWLKKFESENSTPSGSLIQANVTQ